MNNQGRLFKRRHFFSALAFGLGFFISEGIADGEVVAEGLAKTGHVVVAPLAGIVGGMDANAEVEADDKEVQVVAYAYACSERYLLAKVLEGELAARLVLGLPKQPDITRIEEGSTLQMADNREAVLEVGLQLQVAHLVNV